MSKTAAKTLASEIGGRLPAEFDRLSEQQVQALSAAYLNARDRQSAELDEALSRALEHVPALMRRPVRKILGL